MTKKGKTKVTLEIDNNLLARAHKAFNRAAGGGTMADYGGYFEDYLVDLIEFGMKVKEIVPRGEP